MSDRRQVARLKWLHRGRADTLVFLGPELRDPSRFDALAERLCLDPSDIQSARDRAADCTHPHRPTPERHEP